MGFSLKKGSRPMSKLLDSAVANAKNNFHLDEDTLYTSKITVDEGPKLKRWRARSRGRAYEIQKKTSHITLILEGKKEKPLGEPIKKTTLREKKEKAIPKEEKQPKDKVAKPKQEGLRPQREMRRGEKPKKGVINKVFRRKSF